MKRLTQTLGFLAIACVLSSVPVSAGEKLSEVTIGVVLSLSGGAANQGIQTKTGAMIAAEEINSKGGIPALGGAKLRLLFADSQSKPDVGASETERLINNEKVPVMLGAYQSAVTVVATEVAERYKTPWLVTGSVAEIITQRGFKYTFRPNNMASYDVNEMLQAIKTLTQETGKGPKRLGMLVEGTDNGKAFAAAVRKMSKDLGYELVMDEAYSPGVADFSPQLLKIRSAKPEAFLVNMYTPEHILFNKQYYENKLYFPFGLHSAGAGAEDATFYTAVPPQAFNLMFVQEDFQKDITDFAPWTQVVDRKFREALGYELTAFGAQGYSNVWVLYDALQRAASLDKEKLRAAFAATNITSGPALIMGYNKIAFDQTGQNLDSHGVISQNLKGKRTTVWPIANRPKGLQYVWPMPEWKDR